MIIWTTVYPNSLLCHDLLTVSNTHRSINIAKYIPKYIWKDMTGTVDCGILYAMMFCDSIAHAVNRNWPNFFSNEIVYFGLHGDKIGSIILSRGTLINLMKVKKNTLTLITLQSPLCSFYSCFSRKVPYFSFQL